MRVSYWKELVRGKSFGRARLNEMMASRMADARGRWLDLGAGAGPSYERFLPTSLKRVPTDGVAREGVPAVNANLSLPFMDGEFDGAFAMNMLYITEDPVSVLREMRRIVAPGGALVATFPFFFPETPEPHDYHRWTKEGVQRILNEAGWTEIRVEPVGGSGTVFGTTMLPLRGSRIVRLLSAPIIRLWDRIDRSERVTYIWLACAIRPL